MEVSKLVLWVSVTWLLRFVNSSLRIPCGEGHIDVLMLGTKPLIRSFNSCDGFWHAVGQPDVAAEENSRQFLQLLSTQVEMQSNTPVYD